MEFIGPFDGVNTHNAEIELPSSLLANFNLIYDIDPSEDGLLKVHDALKRIKVPKKDK